MGAISAVTASVCALVVTGAALYGGKEYVKAKRLRASRVRPSATLSARTGLSVEDFVHQTWVTSVDARTVKGADRTRLRIS